MSAESLPRDGVQLLSSAPSTEEGTDLRAVDVLVVTALQDELEAVLDLGEGGRAGWHELRDLSGFRYHQRVFPGASEGQFLVAAAWIGDMGERATAIRGAPLLAELNPACLAMCGICAGHRAGTSLGDVIIADRVFGFDEGKRTAGESGVEFEHDLRTFGPEAVWRMDAAYLARELSLGDLVRERPPSKEAQRWWLLHTLHAHEAEGGPTPVSHPDRARTCPDWTAQLKDAIKDGLVTRKGGALQLTDAGRDKVLEDVLLYPDGLSPVPPLRVHVAPIATVKTVREDPAIWEEIHCVEHKTLGLDMEGSAVGDLADRFKKRFLFVKAISDHADHEKNDTFRAFACRASATVLLAFLQKYLGPRSAARTGRDQRSGSPIDTGKPVEPDPQEDGFVARVERVTRLREPGANIRRRSVSLPFAGLLEVAVQDGPVRELRIIGALEQPVTEALVSRYLTEVERPNRLENPYLRSMLVHGGPEAPEELVQSAFRRGVQLKSFAGYQGLLDFSRYLARQTQRLETDPVYPPGLYVDQPARWSLAGGREEQVTEDALTSLADLLDTPHPRFSLVLGDFGAGKTFLLHELARRMTTGGHPATPVLVEMSRLEKQRSLRELLAQHFAQADMGRIDLDAFQYMLGEGRIALLFDGFDELALRVTYERAVEHFETVMQAAQGLAKVVVTSRTQHFLTDQQVRRELAKRAEHVPGYRLFQLDKFGEKQIRRFWENLLGDPQEAEARYELLTEVKDLLGLSENPRMLSFIARIDPEKLFEARKKSGEITAAKLYELLVDWWLDFEHKRANPPGAPHGISRAAMRSAMTEVALLLWHRPERWIEIHELPEHLTSAVQTPGTPALERGVVEHLLGAGSLLVRDPDGRFSFIHRSVLEWLVAESAARDVVDKRDAPALAANEMSELMADFFASLAGRRQAGNWASLMLQGASEGYAKKNSLRVLNRIRKTEDKGHIHDNDLEIVAGVDLSDQDLSGRDLSFADLRKANLTRANLRGATLVKAKLAGASLVSAQLGRADLSGADLSGSDLRGATLSFARLFNANMRGADLSDASLRGAKLVGAQGVALAGLVEAGATPPMPGRAEPMWVPASPCNAVTWSPSGDLVASGHGNGSILLWDAVSGQEIRSFEGHTDGVQSVAFGPNGTTLASRSNDRTVRLWEVFSGRAIQDFKEYKRVTTRVAFSPDGTMLAYGSYDGTVCLWEVSSGHALRVFEGDKTEVQSVAFSPDGTMLASGSDDSTIRLWEISSGRALRAFKGYTRGVNSVAFSPDGITLASGSNDRTVRLWEVSSGRALRAFEGHAHIVLSVAFSPDGTTLASRSYDGTVRLWEVSSGRALRAFEGHTTGVQSVALSPDGTTLASGFDDGTVRLWELSSGRALRAFKRHADFVRSVVFSPDGTTLASGFDGGMVRLWALSSGRAPRSFEGHTTGVQSIAFSPDGTTFAFGCVDRKVRLWEMSSGRTLRAFEGHTHSVRSVAFSPDGTMLASGSDDGTVRLWELSSGLALRAFEGHSNWVRSVAFSPDGSTLAAGTDDGTVRLWELSSGLALRAFEGHATGVQSVAFSPDGTSFAFGSDDRTVRLRDVSSGRILGVFRGHMDWVRSVAFSPDSTTLASASEDGTVRLWEVSSERALRAFKGHKSGVTSVIFSPDGRALASASRDGSIRLWNVATGACLAILVALGEGWAAFTPDGRYRIGGDVAGSFWHVVGLCRFEPGELDPYLPEPLRLPDDASFLSLPPAKDQ